VEIETDETAQTVTGVRIRPTGSKTIPVVARHYVLACGGIENPRLLLAANRVAAAGLGNQNDLVGRFYTDHLYHWPGYFEPASARYDRSLNVIEGYAGMGRNQRAFAAFTLSEEVRRERGLNGAAAYLIRRPRFKAEPEYASEGGVAFTHLIDVLTHAELPDRRLGERFREALAGRRQVRRRVGMQVRHLLRPESRLSIRSVVEMTPNADSRVTLGTAKDRFGMPRVRVDWRLNADDRRGLDQLHAAMHAELRRCGLGTFVQHEMKDRNGWPPSTTGGKHHMGTTRMHTDPRQGVVDPDCRVHGMTNLFVAGSSVFPTGGYVNPTLTIVALAIRLADHLKAQFRERGRP
jgi:choline dehydrogenase-like flavoprotein